MNKPWKDWIPGVLSKNQIRQLCQDGYIQNVDNSEDDNNGPIDYSAIDLKLTGEGYRMVKGSVKPFGDRYKHIIEQQGLIERLPEDDFYELKRANTYLFKLKERITLGNKGARISGQATAKSTIGRMDVLARLIVDGMDHYEGFSPDGLDSGNGDMCILR